MRAVRTLAIALLALVVTFAPAAHAQTVTPAAPPTALNLTADQWAGLPQLVAFVQLTSMWTMADWYSFGTLANHVRAEEDEWYDNVNARAGNHDAIVRVVNRVWGAEAPWTYHIIARESGWNPGATNPKSGACGLFQMLGHEGMFIAAGFGGQCHDPVANIIVAHNLYLAAGTSPWNL